MKRFIALWYDNAKVEALQGPHPARRISPFAIAAGTWRTPHKPTMPDFFRTIPPATGEHSARLQAAVRYLKKEVYAPGKLYLAAPLIREEEQVQRRCRFCDCNGWFPILENFLERDGSFTGPFAVYRYDYEDGCELIQQPWK
jgi:hypothetical protein